ncbi:hypothetical protein HDU97_006533 [Phlyctochytrium planicorne]|nr:hypothetical protein HDU97_006533 [Phlyctochytrium planicorne]
MATEAPASTHLAPPAPAKADAKSTHSTASHRKDRKVVDEGGLSIVERVFFKSPPNRPQVIMGIIIRLRLPPGVPVLKLERVVDLLKWAQSKHYRLSSAIDPETMVAIPLATNAKDLPCNYRFIPRKSRDTWKAVYEEEINTNFDVNDASRPLWRNAIIVREELMPKETDEVMIKSSKLTMPTATPPPPKFHVSDGDAAQEAPATSVENSSTAATVYGMNDPAFPPDQEYYEIMFTFHHCLGDGLSMFAYARTYLEEATAANLNSDDLHLENVAVVTEPPPMIDNLLDPNVFEVLPVMGGMAMRTFTKKGKRFKGRKSNKDEEDERAERPTAVVGKKGERAPSPAPSANPTERSASPNPSVQTGEGPSTAVVPVNGAVSSVPKPLKLAYTRVRFLWFDASFITALRKKAKTEGTTIAAVLVVASLAAVRTSFENLPKYKSGKPLPSHQGWVVTNSVRHMLPMSNLMKGGDREVDEGLKMFGGYAGSVTNSSLLLEDTSDIWERCRVVRKSIGKCFRDSIQRMKLMNYCYRHPSLWKMIEKKVDLAKLSRSYSVEVANLGAWECPAAPSDAGPDDTRVRLDHFGGVVNSSFDGVRGLFTVGVITLGGHMSVAVGYDMGSVYEEDADIFMNALCGILMKLKESQGKTTVLQVRK